MVNETYDKKKTGKNWVAKLIKCKRYDTKSLYIT